MQHLRRTEDPRAFGRHDTEAITPNMFGPFSRRKVELASYPKMEVRSRVSICAGLSAPQTHV
jgi:hypothetical protein